MPFVARLAMMHRCDAVGRAVCGGPGAVLCRRGAYHLDAVWVCCRGASCRRDDALPRCVMPPSMRCRDASCRRDYALPLCVLPPTRCRCRGATCRRDDAVAVMRHAVATMRCRDASCRRVCQRAPGAHPVMTVRIRFLGAVVQSRCFPGYWQMNRCRC